MLVFEQRAHHGGHGQCLVGGLQGAGGNVFGHEQAQPVNQLAGAGLFLQARQLANIKKHLHGRAQQFVFQARKVHIHNLLHGGRFGKLDVVEKAAPQKRIGQLFFVVGGNKHHGPVFGLDQLAGFVAIKLHAVELAQQIVGELNISLVNFVNQQGHGLVGGKGLPQHALHNVVANVLHAGGAIGGVELAVAQAAYGVVFVQTLLCLGGAFDVPLQQRQAQRLGHFFGQQCFAGARLTLDQERALEGDGGIHRQLEVVRGDVVGASVEFHGVWIGWG